MYVLHILPKSYYNDKLKKGNIQLRIFNFYQRGGGISRYMARFTTIKKK